MQINAITWAKLLLTASLTKILTVTEGMYQKLLPAIKLLLRLESSVILCMQCNLIVLNFIRLAKTMNAVTWAKLLLDTNQAVKCKSNC